MINPTVVRMAEGGWRFTWPAGTPPYRVRLEGEQLAEVLVESYEFTGPNYDFVPPAVEVFESTAVSQDKSYPPCRLLQWRGLQIAFAYIIKQLIGLSWVSVGSVSEIKRGYYQWKSPPLDDLSTVQFRVYASDVNGNLGTPLPFTAVVCRNPAPPVVAIDFSTAGDIVVTGG